MKIRIAFLTLLSIVTTMVVSAQVVEYDDMYFNSKDRVRVAAAKPVSMTPAQKEMNQVATPINPTDSYSARNVNPEYISQSKVNTSGVEENVAYFSPDYTPTAVNQNIYNNAIPSNSFYGNPYSNPYNYGMSTFGSPYGSFYPSYSAFSPYGFGSMYPSGWSSFWNVGMSFGYGSMWGSPYMGMGMGCMTCMNNGFGGFGWNPWGFNNFYPGGSVIIIDNNTRPVTYGRRTSRSTDVNNPVYNNNRATTGTATTLVDANGKVRGSGGRTTAGNEPGSYYQQGWRTNTANNSGAVNTSGTSRSGSQSNWFDNSSRNSNSRSSDSFFNSSGSRNSGWSSGGSNSSFSGGRSSGSSSSGSSGVRRGRD
ncbi:MAG: hypothetical protein MUF39_01890 [Cyclobacteriaceae bacterium]|jgi:hypothetical protein|nr:hypothetical protein [Cyclobacteriaceae bacterium]